MKSYKTALGNVFIPIHTEDGIHYGLKFNSIGYGVAVSYSTSGKPLDRHSEDILVQDKFDWVKYVYLAKNHLVLCEDRPVFAAGGGVFSKGKVWFVDRHPDRVGKDCGAETIRTKDDLAICNWHELDLKVLEETFGWTL